MDVPLGPYAVHFLNIPRTITAERLLGALVDTGLQPQGFRDVTRGRDARALIFWVGFPDKQLRQYSHLENTPMLDTDLCTRRDILALADEAANIAHTLQLTTTQDNGLLAQGNIHYPQQTRTPGEKSRGIDNTHTT